MSNLQPQRLTQLCQQLQLSAVPDLYPAVPQGAAAKEASFAEFLEEILRAERDARRAREREMLARVAGFPTVKALDSFDFGVATGVARQQIHALASLAFIKRAENVVFLGPSGVGKAHRAIALGYRLSPGLDNPRTRGDDPPRSECLPPLRPYRRPSCSILLL